MRQFCLQRCLQRSDLPLDDSIPLGLLQRAHIPGYQDGSSLQSGREGYGAMNKICPQNPRSPWHYERVRTGHVKRYGNVRLWIEFIQETTTILLIEYPRESPGLFLKRLDILNLNQEHIAWLGCFNVEWSREVVDLSKIDILHIVG